MSDALGVLLALAALPLLVRLGWGCWGGGGGRVVFRVRAPLRHRYPRLWWSAVLFWFLVVLPVLWLGASCGWWGP